MKRMLAMLLLLLVAVGAAMPTAAHGIALVAAVKLKGSAIAVDVKTVTGAPIPGAAVTAAVGAPGARPGKAVTLTEGPEGTYKGEINTPQSGEFDITIEANAGEVFRTAVRAKGGAELEVEQALTEVPLEEEGFPWSWVLYGVAVAALAVGTVAALRRKDVTTK